MKKYLNKFKEWLVLWTWILVAFSIWTFAYSKIETVKSGDVLSADSYNKLLNIVNEHSSSIEDLQTQNEWIYQNAFDTNEIWTGKYDALTGKKIYSRWIEFGDVSGAAWHRMNKHWIEWIDKVIYVDDYVLNKGKNLMLYNWPHHWIWINSEDLDIYLSANRWADIWLFWFRLEYTKIDD